MFSFFSNKIVNGYFKVTDNRTEQQNSRKITDASVMWHIITIIIYINQMVGLHKIRLYSGGIATAF